jgi:hypothetical protein
MPKRKNAESATANRRNKAASKDEEVFKEEANVLGMGYFSLI